MVFYMKFYLAKEGKSILNSTMGITFEVYHLPVWVYWDFTSIYLNFVDRLPGHTDCARMARNWLCIALKRDRRSYILYDLFAIDLVSLFANLLDIACVLGTACKCKCFRLACSIVYLITEKAVSLMKVTTFAEKVFWHKFFFHSILWQEALRLGNGLFGRRN